MEINKVIKNDHFNLRQIALSGQCFRFRETDDGDFLIVSGNKAVYARQISPNEIGLSCCESEYEKYWQNYFDYPESKEDPYGKIENLIMDSQDDYLKSAFDFGSGMRILRQDLWESIVCFIISQNNNIKRIKGSIDKICAKAGIKVSEGIYKIPEADEVEPGFFLDKGLGLGYRDVFLSNLFAYTKDNPGWYDELKGLKYEDAMKRLTDINGIGPKVANCVCLFGLHHIDAFPIDTHIKQILNTYYPGGFDFERYKGVAGIIQQYMFYYKISQGKKGEQ